MTLLVHLPTWIRGVWIVGVHLAVLLVHLLAAAGILAGHLAAGRRVADGWQLRADAGWVVGIGRRLGGVGSRAVWRLCAADGATVAVLVCFACIVFLLLARLPFLANLLELCARGGNGLVNVNVHVLASAMT